MEKAKEAGVIMTEAGATFPYGNIRMDSNIRIAPTFPTEEELAMATDIFILSVKLVSIENFYQKWNRKQYRGAVPFGSCVFLCAVIYTMTKQRLKVRKRNRRKIK